MLPPLRRNFPLKLSYLGVANNFLDLIVSGQADETDLIVIVIFSTQRKKCAKISLRNRKKTLFFWKKLRFCAIWHSWIKKLCGYFFLLNKCQYLTFQENLEQSHLALKRINNCNGGPRLKKIQARSFTPCSAKGKICKKFMQTV